MKNGATVSKKRKAARRVDFVGDRDDHTLLTYIGLGYTTRFIESSTGLSAWQIAYRAMKLRKLGISREDYRNGRGTVAQIVREQAQTAIDAALIRYLENRL